jgi:hypothetical protein
MEDIIEYIKEIPKNFSGQTELIFQKAIEFNQVTEKRMVELEEIYKNSKNQRRVLFVKDLTSAEVTERTYMKPFPNLPDDDMVD